MKIFLALLFISAKAFALEAVITVLETPMLKTRSYEAPVVQYLRKGDVIKIDPALANTKKYDHMGKYKPKTSPDSDEEFVMTLDRQGNKVWVIRRHLYIYSENEEEFDQTIAKVDETDYRLEEPLPKKYPLESPSGYRGQVTFGITQPYTESYDYDSTVKMKGYQSPLDVNITLLRQAPTDNQDRFYLGGTLGVRYFSNSYSLTNNRFAKENGLRLGLGPTMSYDTFKGEKDRVNLYGTIMINLFNQLTISQEDQNSNTDERIYRTISVSPRLGIQYHRKKILEDIDFIIGTALEIDTPSTYRSQNAASQIGWWRRGGNDKFNTRATFTLAGYLGIQSAY